VIGPEAGRDRTIFVQLTEEKGEGERKEKNNGNSIHGQKGEKRGGGQVPRKGWISHHKTKKGKRGVIECPSFDGRSKYPLCCGLKLTRKIQRSICKKREGGGTLPLPGKEEERDLFFVLPFEKRRQKTGAPVHIVQEERKRKKKGLLEIQQGKKGERIRRWQRKRRPILKTQEKGRKKKKRTGSIPLGEERKS